MPKKLERCVKKIKKQGQDADSAWAICRDAINKAKKKKKKKSK